ncbi:MAG: GNAT family N-acetyltransferase [Verrucomicrobia bacterium]|nr:GNAT family N-acetyltransferase [Verrucomicrobiota bacterium]
MKSRRVKMSLEEFHRLPFKPAWKQEYINGCLIESPRWVIVHATIPVSPRPFKSPVPLRPAKAGDEQALLPSFRAAFKDVFEFCDNTQKQFSQSARQSLHHFFHGPFHLALPASRVAIGRPGTLEAGRPIGAALVLAQEEGWALLDMIFVKPTWHRRGLATALAAAALTALHEQGGYRTLVSRYHLGNEPSRAWHHNFGFADEPDLRLAQLHLRAAIHELRRLRESGQLTSQENRRLNRERARWQKEADRLEALVKAGREDEADPWRKWRRKPRDDEMIVLKKPAVPQQKDV